MTGFSPSDHLDDGDPRFELNDLDTFDFSRLEKGARWIPISDFSLMRLRPTTIASNRRPYI